MNSLRVTDTHPNAQLNTSTHRTAELLRPKAGNIISASELGIGINYFGMYGRNVFGQTYGIDVQGRTLEDGVTPQPGITEFAQNLGVRPDQLIMPRLDKHTTKVLVVKDRDQLCFVAAQGCSVGYDRTTDNTFIDALIIKENPETSQMVLGIHGADCPAIVGFAGLSDGTKVMFGLHAGRKGCLGGIVENTANVLLQMGVVSGSVRMAIGPGGQTLELPLDTVQAEAAVNSHDSTQGIWKNSAVVRYNGADSRKPMIIYDNQADVIRRVQIVFGDLGLLAPSGCYVIDANTLTDEKLKSYRASTIAKAAGDEASVQNKFGRNALFARFNW